MSSGDGSVVSTSTDPPSVPGSLGKLEIDALPEHVQDHVQVVGAVDAAEREGERPGEGVVPAGLDSSLQPCQRTSGSPRSLT